MTPTTITPGPDGTPVPDGLHVFRLANEPALSSLSPEFLRRVEQGQSLPSFFNLSSEDEKQPVPRLSVWVEGPTTLAQAWVLVGANPKRRWVSVLSVNGIRAVFAAPADKFPRTPKFDVQWERATTLVADGARVPELRPGWAGHAGIANLNLGNKTQRAEMKWKLAELAAVQVLSENELQQFASPPSA